MIEKTIRISFILNIIESFRLVDFIHEPCITTLCIQQFSRQQQLSRCDLSASDQVFDGLGIQSVTMLN